MSTIKVDSIKSADGNTDLLTLSNGAVSGVNLGRRNLIINGAMQVAQRGTSFTSNGYSIDRWKFYNSGGTFTASQVDTTAGSRPEFGLTKAFQMVRSLPSGILYTTQLIEDVALFDNVDVTVSFYAKADASVGLPLRLSQVFGSGGSSAVSLGSQTANLTTSWQRFTLTYTCPSVSGKTIGANNHLEVTFDVPATTDTFQITGVQLEVGSVATPFEHRSYGEELALCQRYYWRWVAEHPYNNISMANVVTSNYGIMSTVPMPVTLRAHPSISWGGNMRIYSFIQSASRQLNSITNHRGNTNTVGLTAGWATALSGANAYPCEFGGLNDSSAYVAFDAEL